MTRKLRNYKKSKRKCSMTQEQRLASRSLLTSPTLPRMMIHKNTSNGFGRGSALRQIMSLTNLVILITSKKGTIFDLTKEPILPKKISGEPISTSMDTFTSLRGALMEQSLHASYISSFMGAVVSMPHGPKYSKKAQKAQAGEPTETLDNPLGSEQLLTPTIKLCLFQAEEMLAMIWELKWFGPWVKTTTLMCSTKMASKLKPL